MRGLDEQTGLLFSDVSCEARVPADHPLRLIRAVVDEALDVLSPEFDRLYAGRIASFRMMAVMATLGGFPAAMRAWYLAFMSALKRIAPRVGM